MFRLLAAAGPCFLLLAGCSSPVGDAEKRLEIAENSGDAAAVCGESTRLAEAYLNAKDEERYKTQKLAADVACLSAELDAAQPRQVDQMVNLDATRP